MVVKIDINDNDYGERIENILIKKVYGLWSIVDDYYDAELEQYKESQSHEDICKYVDIAKERDSIRECLSKDKMSTQYIYMASDIIKKSVLFLIKNSFSNEDLKYLEERIEVTFPSGISGKWENGEVIYYFPSTYSKTKFMLF